MRYDITYRPATFEDVDFCVETFIRAEKGRGDVFPLSRIFNMTEEDLRPVLRTIFLEDIEGQEMAISSFTILMHGNQYAGACGSFVECINGVSSNRIKSDILMHYIPAEKFQQAIPALNLVQPLNIQREPLTVQLESLYIIKEYRSMELYLEMVRTIAEKRIAQYPHLNIRKSFAGFSGQNWFMGKAAARIGYVHYQTIELDDTRALEYISDLKRIFVMKQH